MASVLFGGKYAVLVVSEIFVVVALIVLFVLGIYQIVRDKVREGQKFDEIITEILSDKLKVH